MHAVCSLFYIAKSTNSKRFKRHSPTTSGQPQPILINELAAQSEILQENAGSTVPAAEGQRVQRSSGAGTFFEHEEQKI